MGAQPHTNFRAVSCIALLLLLLLQGYTCTGFSLTLSSSAVSGSGRTSTSAKKSDWLIEVGPAILPRDLAKIQACRITAFAKKTNKNGDSNNNNQLMRPQRSFVNAESAQRGDAICLVARERLPPFRILGTADVSSRMKRNFDGAYLIQNVFVLPEARGRGLARRLVQGAEEFALSSTNAVAATAAATTPARIYLTVETSNLPAVTLYETCDYQTKDGNGLLLSFAQATGFPLIVDMVKELS